MAKECQKCKDYRDCLGKEWYNYSEIRFCPYQIIWIIEQSATLIMGDWPNNPDGSSYADPAIKSAFANEGYFVKPELVLGEVEYRLKTTDEAGEALIDEVQKSGIINIDSLSRPARRALMYIKGKRRKKQSYPQWKANKKYLVKKR